MKKEKTDELLIDHNHDGIVMQGGILKSFSLSRLSEIGFGAVAGELRFVQISDSHMGFNKPANPDVAGTLKAAVDKIKALPNAPEFLLHTGDNR
jgi:3',5'-cyclic-AMP phosphodiesterase